MMSPLLLAAGMLRTEGRLAEPSVCEPEISPRSESAFLSVPLSHGQKEASYFPGQAANARRD